SETNQQVSDFHTTEGSVNGSLTDRHYSQSCLFFYLLAATPGSQYHSDCLFLVSLKLHPALPVGGDFLCLTHLF
ncbi:hypothetical protein ACK36D_11255, partial [Aeromonas veronii]